MEAAQAKTVPITERLRNIKIGSYTVDHGSHTKHIAVRAICEEAATEIERLRKLDTQGNEAPSTSPQYKPAAAEPEAKLQHEEAARSPRMQGNHSPEGINLGRMLGEDEAHALDCSPLLKGAGAGRARSATEMQIRLGQTRAHSLLESLANIGIGFGVSVLANYLILPLYGMESSMRSSFEIGVWFTLISFARSYLLRRAFNWININTGRGSR